MNIQNVILLFQHPDMEKSYSERVLERTVVYCRIAWVVFFLAAMAFGFLDRTSFGEKMSAVTLGRAGMALVAVFVIGVTFVKRLRPLLRFSSPLFILVPGLFTVLVTGFSASDRFSPYIMSFCFAFAGIFTTPGIGFIYSVGAMLTVLVVFNTVFFVYCIIPLNYLVVYDFFIIGLIVVFTTAGYLVEKALRHDFVISMKLRESLQQVKTLRGLLPICAACKKVRDDRGYWRQIESYLSLHTQASFTHGICPDCADKLYPSISPKPE